MIYAGIFLQFAADAAWNLRSPSMSKYLLPLGVTTMGTRTPKFLIESFKSGSFWSFVRMSMPQRILRVSVDLIDWNVL